MSRVDLMLIAKKIRLGEVMTKEGVENVKIVGATQFSRLVQGGIIGRASVRVSGSSTYYIEATTILGNTIGCDVTAGNERKAFLDVQLSEEGGLL